MIDQLSVFLENKSGRLAELCRALGEAGINMHALMVADTSEFGVIRIICDTPSRGEATPRRPRIRRLAHHGHRNRDSGSPWRTGRRTGRA